MKVHVLALAAAVCFVPTIASAQAKPAAPKAQTAPTTQFDRNLLKNGSAEAEGKDEKQVPGWTLIDGLTENKYGSVSGEWDWGLSGCKGCGVRYLRLDFNSGTHELATSQTIDVTPSAKQIDGGDVTAAISAYLGGFLNSSTTATISASFQDATGKELGKIETKPYDTATLPKAERGSAALTECDASGAVPSGTRKIVFTWKAKALDDSGDYLGLGDNFSLTLKLNDKSKS
jgi:hypothetical protein